MDDSGWCQRRPEPQAGYHQIAHYLLPPALLYLRDPEISSRAALQISLS